MPTYQYACTECGHSFEQFQSFSEDALTVCPECDGRLRKLFNAVGVVFKGSGFYRTDSRSDSGSSASASSSTGVQHLAVLDPVDQLLVELVLQLVVQLLVQLVVQLVRLTHRWSRRSRSDRHETPVESPSGRRSPRPSVGACSRDSRRPGAGCAPYDTSCGAAVG